MSEKRGNNESSRLSEKGEERAEEVGRLRKEIDQTQKELEELRDKDLNKANNEGAEVIHEKISEKERRLEELTSELAHTTEILKDIEETRSDIENLRGEFQKTIKDAEGRLEQLQSNHEHIKETTNNIRNVEEEIEETYDNVQELEETAEGLLERTTSSALGEQFADRKQELEGSLLYWKVAAVASIGLLLVSAGVIYYDISTSPESSFLGLSKLALIVPVSVAVWFSVSNYSRQKKLMEEYEFKARMALSLNGFREVLNAELDQDDDQRIAEFVIASMDKIYSNPQQNIDAEESATSRDAEPLPSSQKPLVELIKRLSS